MVPGEGEHRGRHSLPGFCAVRQRGHKVDSTPLLTFGSPVLQDHPFAGSNHFSHWRAAAAVAQVTASTLGVTTKLTSLDSFFTVTTI